MIDAYSQFKPANQLRTKYIFYVISFVLLLWIVLNIVMGIILLNYSETFSFKDDFGDKSIIPTTIRAVVLLVIGLPLSVYYYNSISYEIVKDEVHVNRGIITKTRKIVPYRTITNIEIKRGLYDRALGIGTIELQTAGISKRKWGPEERLDGICKEQLNEVQQLLINHVRKITGVSGTTLDIESSEPATDTLSAILIEIRELKAILIDK
ncbi:MAG: PH domain-containing protein [Candidatus Kariarchaeaceae archaeon]|jgi:membrane protein YdbS with pleckstrin-like domain